MKESTDPMITESLPVPVYGRDGEPCSLCQAPLAGDQRYCLHCGTRRPEARLAFLDVLDADVRAGGPPLGSPPAIVATGAAVPPPSGLGARLNAQSGALALGVLLALMLLIGLLVGHWVTGDKATTAAAPAPQVIKVEGAAAPAATTAAPAATAAPSSDAGAKSSGAKSGVKAKATGDVPKDAVSVDKVANDKKAIDQAVKKGQPLSTGSGAPPPTDDKPAGGGSGFQTIG